MNLKKFKPRPSQPWQHKTTSSLFLTFSFGKNSKTLILEGNSGTKSKFLTLLFLILSFMVWVWSEISIVITL